MPRGKCLNGGANAHNNRCSLQKALVYNFYEVKARGDAGRRAAAGEIERAGWRWKVSGARADYYPSMVLLKAEDLGWTNERDAHCCMMGVS